MFFPWAPGSASAQIDPRGTWRTWTTTHFRVHAREEHRAVAIAAANEAELAYAGLSRELVPPRGTIDLVLYDNVDFANGFTTTVPRNRIALYLTSPAGEAGLSRYDDWLRLVITHELTHVFHLDRTRGLWRTGQRVFGRAPGLFPNAYRPSWVTEGIAVYYETRLTEGGRLRSGYHGQVLTGAALGGRFPDPGDANFATAKWPAGLRPYAFGSRFLDWEARTYGAAVLPKFVENMSGRLWPLEISGPLARAGGARLGPGWKQFRESWMPDSLAGEPARVLVRSLRVAPRPRLSADGRWIAYVDTDGKNTSHVVVRDARTWVESGRHLITAEVELAWIGAELVVAQLEFHAPVEIRTGLYRWAPPPSPGSAWRRASPVARLTRPFAINDSVVGAVQLSTAANRLVRLAGDGVAPIAAPPADGWSRLSASPDGQWIAGARHLDGRWDIVRWPAGRPAEARRLTNDAALDEDPVWTPDGSTVVFMSERAGLPQIFGVRVANGTTELVQLTREPTGAREPAVGTDGTIYYTTVLGDGYAILSRRLEPTQPDPVDLSAPGALAPAPDAAARESGSRPFGGVVPTWWWPVWHDGGSAGRFVGGLTSGADHVGRLAYRAGLSRGLDNPRWEWAAGVGYTRWSRVSLDASASGTWGPGGRVNVAGISYPVDERETVAAAGLTIRHRRWRSDASIRLGAEVSQDAFFVNAGPVQFINPTLAGGTVSFRAARFDSRALAISTESGLVLTGSYRRRWDLGTRLWSHDVHGALRAYSALPLPGFSRWVLAARVAGAVSGGPGAPPAFGIGGESSDIFTIVPGVSVGGGGREFPLRGYPRSSAGFTRVTVGAAELRIPLFLIGKGVPGLPLALDKVFVSVFGEAGGGWLAGGAANLTRFRDVGAELVTDWGINYDTPLRVRAGVARGLTTWVGGTPGGTRWYVALGSSF